MAKYNDKLFIKPDGTEVEESANIYSTTNDLNTGEPYLEVTFDDGRKGFVQGTSELDSDLALSAYVKKDNESTPFRLASMANSDIPAATVVFETSGKGKTFTVPPGITKVLAFLINPGSYYDFLTGDGTEEDIIKKTLPLKDKTSITYLGKTYEPLDNLNLGLFGVDPVYVEYPSHINALRNRVARGFFVETQTGLPFKTFINSAMRGITYGVSSANVPNDLVNRSTFDASVLPILLNIDNDNRDILINVPGSEIKNDPLEGLIEKKNVDIPPTKFTHNGTTNPTEYKFPINGKRPTKFSVNIVGPGGVGGGSVDLYGKLNPSSDFDDGTSVKIKYGNGKELRVVANHPVNSSFDVPAEPLKNNENSSMSTINNLDIPDTAGRGKDGQSINQPYIDGIEGFNQPILTGGKGGAPGMKGEPGKVSVFGILKDDLTVSHAKSGAGGAGGQIITGNIQTIPSSAYENSGEVVVSLSKSPNTNAHVQVNIGGSSLADGGTKMILHPSRGAVVFIYGADIEAGNPPTNYVVPDSFFRSINGKYYVDEFRFTYPDSPKKINIWPILEGEPDSKTYKIEELKKLNGKIEQGDVVLEYFDEDASSWKNFTTDKRQFEFTYLTSSRGDDKEGATITIPLSVYSTRWRIKNKSRGKQRYHIAAIKSYLVTEYINRKITNPQIIKI